MEQILQHNVLSQADANLTYIDPPPTQSMSASTPVRRKALLFPWGVVDRHLINIDLPTPTTTLGDNEALIVAAVFDPDPSQCSRCLKPYLRHRALPNVGFSIFTGCTHGTEPEWHTQYPNKAVAAMLPDPSQTCLGCVLVVKHPLSTDPKVSNRDLPILDVEQADIPYLNEIVKRWAVNLYKLSQKS
ncbi:hypothetical protein B0H11DRAFT_2260905 [Mycena galericulata]|nr:hypothetical protein B0H11DRAFT_2260905 [Mycena galericulata]